MEAPEGWANPLAKLPPILGHPSLSLDDAPISSLSRKSSEQYEEELRQKSQQTLANYSPVESSVGDDTPKLLGIFLEHLLDVGGQITLMEEIEDFKDDPYKLHLLRNFLVDAILKPSTWHTSYQTYRL